MQGELQQEHVVAVSGSSDTNGNPSPQAERRSSSPSDEDGFGDTAPLSDFVQPDRSPSRDSHDVPRMSTSALSKSQRLSKEVGNSEARMRSSTEHDRHAGESRTSSAGAVASPFI